VTAPTDTDLESGAAAADQLAAKIRSWKSGAPVPTPPPSPTPVPSPGSQWALAVDEQFDKGTLDSKVWWPPYDGAKGTGGIGTRKGSLCTFRNGQLVLAAERPSNTNTDYNQWFSTGVAMGPVAQTYGRWEIAASASDGAGFWPNLQLWPTAGKQPGLGSKSDGWPKTIEFDIFESPVGTRDRAFATVHYGSNNTQKSASYSADFNQFNTWVVEWTPTALLVLLNGLQVAKVVDPALIPTTPHHLVAQTDMGSWAGVPTTKDPTRMELVLDHVKQWRYVG